MGNVIYSMSMSVDGFIEDRAGAIDFTAPDEELHRFHNDRVRELSGFLWGRRLYQEMDPYWGSLDPSGADAYVAEFAEIYRALPKVIFSTTLEEVGEKARLVRENAVEEIRALREQSEGPLDLGGAGLAASVMPHGLIDEYKIFIAPTVLGAGKPFFPPLDDRVQLRLVETRTFATAVLLHYQAV